MNDPDMYGLPNHLYDAMFSAPEDRMIEMVKVAFMLVLASWMTACLMAIVYSKDIAEFIVERSQ